MLNEIALEIDLGDKYRKENKQANKQMLCSVFISMSNHKFGGVSVGDNILNSAKQVI